MFFLGPNAYLDPVNHVNTEAKHFFSYAMGGKVLFAVFSAYGFFLMLLLYFPFLFLS